MQTKILNTKILKSNQYDFLIFFTLNIARVKSKFNYREYSRNSNYLTLDPTKL